MIRSIKIIPARVWVHQGNGATASIYGACPWTNPADKGYWIIEHRGYTWECIDHRGNVTIGLCRKPAETQEEAEVIRLRALAL